jgi:hypothetical protein
MRPRANSSEYAILERGGRSGFYRLERKDDRFGDDTTPEGRTQLRLHHPGRTIGCIAACDAEGWGRLEGLLKATATSTATVEAGSETMRSLREMTGRPQKTESVTQFGRLRVLPSGAELTYDDKTGSVDVKFTVTGSRIPRKAHVCTADPKTGRCQ